MKNSATLLIECPDQRGIVAAVADFVFRHEGNILHADKLRASPPFHDRVSIEGDSRKARRCPVSS